MCLPQQTSGLVASTKRQRPETPTFDWSNLELLSRLAAAHAPADSARTKELDLDALTYIPARTSSFDPDSIPHRRRTRANRKPAGISKHRRVATSLVHRIVHV